MHLDDQSGVRAHPEGRRTPLAASCHQLHHHQGASLCRQRGSRPPLPAPHPPISLLGTPAVLRAVGVSSQPHPQGEETGRQRTPLPEAPEARAGAGIQDQAPG